LILLARCFLIGILVTFSAHQTNWQPKYTAFTAAMYVCCFVCFSAAGFILYLGVCQALR